MVSPGVRRQGVERTVSSWAGMGNKRGATLCLGLQGMRGQHLCPGPSALSSRLRDQSEDYSPPSAFSSTHWRGSQQSRALSANSGPAHWARSRGWGGSGGGVVMQGRGSRPPRWGGWGGGAGGGTTSFLGKGGSTKGIKAARARAQAGFRVVLGRVLVPESYHPAKAAETSLSTKGLSVQCSSRRI